MLSFIIFYFLFVLLILIKLIICIKNYILANREIDYLKKKSPNVEHFNKIMDKYFINLEKRKDRLLITTELLNNKGYNNLIIYPAIDGSKLTNDELKKYVVSNAIKNEFRNSHDQLSIGAVGCYLSHINIWKKMIELNKPRIMIFEDDTYPSINIIDLMNKIQNIPEDCDILLIGGLYNRSNTVNKYLCSVKKFYCTHAYMINNTNNIKKIVEKALPMSKQIDSWLNDLSKTDEIKIYGLIDDTWIQNEKNNIGTTDIQIPLKTDIPLDVD
jgi:hypothetical protein